jgi:hypothetical protein
MSEHKHPQTWWTDPEMWQEGMLLQDFQLPCLLLPHVPLHIYPCWCWPGVVSCAAPGRRGAGVCVQTLLSGRAAATPVCAPTLNHGAMHLWGGQCVCLWCVPSTVYPYLNPNMSRPQPRHLPFMRLCVSAVCLSCSRARHGQQWRPCSTCRAAGRAVFGDKHVQLYVCCWLRVLPAHCRCREDSLPHGMA